ncbi:unnamed protein product [Amoebophrya sp. A25]|nr:unnamed protein product [Amoebophrya sp. A25]|eukprot:GSA25T00027387001.1
MLDDLGKHAPRLSGLLHKTGQATELLRGDAEKAKSQAVTPQSWLIELYQEAAKHAAAVSDALMEIRHSAAAKAALASEVSAIGVSADAARTAAQTASDAPTQSAGSATSTRPVASQDGGRFCAVLNQNQSNKANDHERLRLDYGPI